MNARTAAALTTALEDLNTLGAALVRTFNTAPFPTCSRLARTIRTTLSPSDIWKTLEPGTFARADAMLRDVQTLRLSVDGLPGIDPKLAARVRAIGDALLEYRAALEPAAVGAELLAA
jgi:hypothetical protein